MQNRGLFHKSVPNAPTPPENCPVFPAIGKEDGGQLHMEAKRFAVKGINIQAGGEYDTFEQIEPAADAGVRVYNIGLSEVVEDTEFYRKVLEQDVRSYSKFRQKKVAYAVIEAEKVLFTARLLKSKQALKCDLG